MKQEAAAQGPPSNEDNNGFAWGNCGNLDLSTRVSLKQQAVDDAFDYARQLSEQLREGIAHIDPSHAKAFELMGGYEIRAWMEEMSEYRLHRLNVPNPADT